jgi:hypothetical protein
MEIKLNIPEYQKDTGIKYNWQNGFSIKIEIEDNTVLIKANREGLMSLANHLVNLAQQDIPWGYHAHFDDLNSLEEGSSELIVEKTP